MHDVFPRHLHAPAIPVHCRAALLLAHVLLQQMPVALLHVVHDHGGPAWQYCSRLDPAHLVRHDEVRGVTPHVVVAQRHRHPAFRRILVRHDDVALLAHWETARFAEHVLRVLPAAVFHVLRAAECSETQTTFLQNELALPFPVLWICQEGCVGEGTLSGLVPFGVQSSEPGQAHVEVARRHASWQLLQPLACLHRNTRPSNRPSGVNLSAHEAHERLDLVVVVHVAQMREGAPVHAHAHVRHLGLLAHANGSRVVGQNVPAHAAPQGRGLVIGPEVRATEMHFQLLLPVLRIVPRPTAACERAVHGGELHSALRIQPVLRGVVRMRRQQGMFAQESCEVLSTTDVLVLLRPPRHVLRLQNLCVEDV